MRRGTLVLGLLLALTACSVTVTVPLPPQEVKVPVASDTMGLIVYPADPPPFPSPGSVLKNVVVRGTLEANQKLNLTLDLYARTTDPKNDGNCIALRDFATTYAYACPPGPEDGPIGRATFNGTASASLQLQGEKLTQGLQQGRIWLGVMVQGLPAGQVALIFKNLVATVTLGL
jgi:hypothetical protein